MTKFFLLRKADCAFFMVVNAPGTATWQSSNVHAVAGAGEFCRVSAEGGPVRQSTLTSEENLA